MSRPAARPRYELEEVPHPEREPRGRLKRQLAAAIEELAQPRAMPELPLPDPGILQRTVDLLGPVCDVYFRSEVRHLERMPAGQTMLVGQHDGGLLPLDGLCLGIGWHRHFRFERTLRILVHEIPFHLVTSVTRWLHGVGAVSAAPDNLEALLDRGESVLIYPGAAREAFRTYRRRREVDLGGRTGFVRRALRRGIPITPVASAGAHETFFVLLRGERLAHWMGIYKHFKADAWPLTVGLPWGIWWAPLLPYIPLPSKITIEVQRPIDLLDELSSHFHREIRRSDAENPEVVRAGFEFVKNAVCTAVGRLYDERRYPVVG